jgi:hypothetical protein
VPGDHGPGSWATTYSHDFVDAASRLFILYRSRGHQKALSHLASVFRFNGISSCRGSTMTLARVEYLFDAHLRRHIASLDAKT